MSEVNSKCSEPGCDGGWINLQHPMRPNVVMQRVACKVCNADMSKPDNWFEDTTYYVTGVDMSKGESVTTETYVSVDEDDEVVVEPKEVVDTTAELQLEGKIFYVERDADGNEVSRDEMDGELMLKALLTVFTNAVDGLINQPPTEEELEKI